MQSISAQDAYDDLQKEEAILIDVRESGEYDAANIEGAALAPLSDLINAIQAVDIPQNKKIIVHCLKGGRSAQAIAFLQENVFKGHDVYNMEGGILAWAEAGLPINKPAATK